MRTPSHPKIVIVTGLSGAGLSTCLNALQDLGFYTIDNLPVALLSETLKFLHEKDHLRGRGVAFGMDIRDHEFAVGFASIKEKIRQEMPSFSIEVIFITADFDVLVDRYSTSRRKHPLLDHEESLTKAIRCEKELLEPVLKVSDLIIDTSLLSPNNLSGILEKYDLDPVNDSQQRKLYLTIASFGFKHGILRPAETIFDVRFLPNPYFVPSLREFSGKDPAVAQFVFRDALAKETYERFESLVRYLLPHYLDEGKFVFRLGFGCTGGQHRSVAFAERLYQSLTEKPIARVIPTVVHRDMEVL